MEPRKVLSSKSAILRAVWNRLERLILELPTGDAFQPRLAPGDSFAIPKPNGRTSAIVIADDWLA